jgi:hypothetical protein
MEESMIRQPRGELAILVPLPDELVFPAMRMYNIIGALGSE